MSRNAVYKISGIEFANSNSEKAIDEQDENSQTAKYLNHITLSSISVPQYVWFFPL